MSSKAMLKLQKMKKDLWIYEVCEGCEVIKAIVLQARLFPSEKKKIEKWRSLQEKNSDEQKQHFKIISIFWTSKKRRGKKLKYTSLGTERSSLPGQNYFKSTVLYL